MVELVLCCAVLCCAVLRCDALLRSGGFYHPAKPDPPCLSCQANYYEATLRTIFCNMQLRPWFGGVYWWKWSSDPDPWSHAGEGTPYNHASGNNSDFYPQNKPAQGVIEKYYRHGCPSGGSD
eukprot:COSAG06_NODE_9341_length_1926_cov_3.072797_3_plen_122_part_00